MTDVRDWDEIPAHEKLTPERIRELVGEGDPGGFRRYLQLLQVPEDRRCHMAARGVGGVWWPCARAVAPGQRYCPVHTGDPTHTTVAVVGGPPSRRRRWRNRARLLLRRRRP